MKNKNIKWLSLVILLLFAAFLIPFTYSKYTKKYTKPLNLNIVSPRYTVSFNALGGQGWSTPSQEITYGYSIADLTQNMPTKTGYTFMGWYDNADYTQGTQYYDENGDAVLSVWEITSDTTLYAGWAANELVFDNKTVNKTYSTSAQTASVTPATNGTGSYTYTKVATGSDADITVDLYGTINIPATKNAGTYTVIIEVEDNGSHAKKQATYTIKIAKQVVKKVTNLTVTNNGEVTWTNSSNATGYQISFDGTNYVNATNGGNYLNEITATTGEKTIYIKAINSDTTNYQSNSTSIASQTVNVYGITASSNNTTYGTVSPTALNIIGGTTYNATDNRISFADGREIVATPNTGYHFDSWSVSTSGAITGTLAITATFVPNTNTPYVVNHYVHKLSTNTYALNSTDNLTGTTDASLTLTDLKKTIAGFTYVDGYLTGDTTKPESGAVTTTTILPDGTRVINLYYRRNHLYVQYHVNGGALSSSHGAGYGESNSLITYTGNTEGATKFLRGAYGLKVGYTNTTNYPSATSGLHNWSNSNAINIIKTGYTINSNSVWCTNADGTGTCYDQVDTNINANTFAGVDLSTGDKTATIYAHWVPVTYTISYTLNDGTVSPANPESYTIESSAITLTNPTKTGYTFAGWTGSNGSTPSTSVTIASGSTGNKTYTANWTANSYTIVFNKNDEDATGTMSNQAMTYDVAANLIANAFTNQGYTFGGWATTSSGAKVYNDKQSVSNLAATGTFNLYAVWTPNELVFTNQTRSTTYDKNNPQTVIVTPATNGTGTYTYTKVTTGSDANITVASDGTITVPKNKAAGTYEVIVRATDAKSGVYKDAKYTITVNPQTVNPVTNLAVNPAGIVTWTNSSNATGYEISIDGTNWTSATNGMDYLSTIASTTGTRTVRVRAINSDSANYTTPSSEVTKNVTVVTLTTNVNNASYGTVDSSTYNVISGVSYQVASNVLTVKYGTTTLKTITATPASTTGYTTEFSGWKKGSTIVTTGTITANTTITANFARSEDKYTITYALNGGTVTTPNPTSYSVTTTTFTLNNPTKTGYTFAGWSGKNLFNIDEAIDDYYIKASNGQAAAYVSSSTPWSCSDYIEIEGGKTYTFNPNSTAGSSSTAHAVYDANKNFIQSYTTGVNTITTPSNAKYIRVSYRRSNSTNIQLEEGSTATAYEPYMNKQMTVTIPKGSTGDRTYTANWTANSYTIVFNKNDEDATGSMSNQSMTYDVAANLTANAFANQGYTFGGWATTSSGAKVYNDKQSVSNLAATGTFNLYAIWNANEIVLSDKTINKTYSTSSQTATVDAATNGTGTYTYTKVTTGSDADITVASNGTITIPAKKAVGTYTVNIKATDAKSGKTDTATYTIVIGKQTVNPVTNLAVSTAGVATWTNSSNATGYEISIDGTNWTSATSGIDYSSTIKAATGERTVRVRAINSDTTNYTTPSTVVSKKVNVYTVTLTKGTGISSVSGAGKYIGGATVTLGAIVSDGYSWSKWTQTSGGATVSTTQAYSATINADWSYTANAVANSYTVTANSNGGTIPTTTNWTGSGNTATKSVTYNTAYGNLPSPTKTGYDFAGWTLLPEGYTQVEYIQFSGTQYIDTGVLTKQSLKIESEFSTTTASKLFFGGRTSPSVNSLVFGYFANKQSYVGFGSSTANYSTTMNLIDGNKHKVILSNNIYQIDGIDQTISNRATLSNFYNIYLGTWNNAGTPDDRKYIGKVYSFTIYDGDTLVRDFIPCVNESTGKAGLYDIVNGVFYGDANGGTFTVPEAEYITSETIVKTSADHNIYAHWTPKTYTINLNKNGATNTPTASVTATYNSSVLSPASITLPTRSYTISGFGLDASRGSDGATVSSTSNVTNSYTFNGWYTATSGGSLVLSKAASPVLQANVSGYTGAGGKWTKDSGTTLYARWSSNNSTLPTITKDGYTCGWTTSSTGTTIELKSGKNDYVVTANTTLYGVCLPNTVTITIKNDGTAMSNSGLNVALYSGTTSKYAYSTATVSGSTVTFTGVKAGTYNVYISKDSNHLTTLVDSGIDVSVTTGTTTAGTDSKDVNYNTLTIGTNHTTVKVNGTNVTNNGTVKVAKSIAHDIVATAANGYQFASSATIWTKNNTNASIASTTTAATTTTLTGTAKLTATATPVTYTIGYTLNGGTVSPANPTSYTIESNDITLTNPTKTGYTFAGWTGSNGATPQTIVTIASGSTGNRNYTANWTPNTYTATFYYNSNLTSGSLTLEKITKTCTISDDTNTCSIAIPSEVTESIGKYNSSYLGVSNSLSSMAIVDNETVSISADTNFYSVYSTPVTIYYQTGNVDSTTGELSNLATNSYSYYRNEFITNITSGSEAMTSILNSSQTSTTNFTFTPGVSGYSLRGFRTTANSTTRSYSTVSSSANSNATNLFVILRKGLTATVYYNSGSGDGTLEVATATTATAYRYIYCKSTTEVAMANQNYAIPAAVSESVGQYGNKFYELSQSLNSMIANRGTASSSTATTANVRTLYAIYQGNDISGETAYVTNYYYGNEYATRPLYRNAFFTSVTGSGAMSTVLSTSNTGTSNYSTTVGPGNSVWTGLASSATTAVEYSNVASAAISTETTLYSIYTFNVTYSKGSNVSSIGSTSGSCKVTTANTSCNVTLPSITANTGYTAVGWNTTSGATTGIAANTPYELTANAITLYANATANEISLADKTLNAGTYGTAYTSNAFDAATNGTGSYTYTIKSGAPTGATINSTNRTISFTNSTAAGTYNVVVTATDNGSGKTDDATMTIVINRKGVAFPTCADKVYTAAEQTLFAAHTSGEYTNSALKGTNVNSYTVSLTPTANYQWNSGTDVTSERTLTCSITKSDTTTILNAITKTYTGSAQAASGAVAKLGSNSSTISNPTITYKYYTNNTCTTGETTEAPIDVGTYYVKAYLTGTTNYNASETGCVTYTMNKADAVCPTVTSYSGTYNGKSHYVTVTGGSGGTIKYEKSTNGGSTYTDMDTSNPARTSAGTTYVRVRVEGDSNHNNVTCDTKTVTIAKKDVTITAGSTSRAWNNSALTNTTCTGNDLVSGHTVTCTMTSESTITTAGLVDNVISTYTIKSGSTDVTANYNVTTAKGILTVTLATPTLSLTAKSAEYTGSAIAANSVTASPDAGGTKSYTYYSSTDCSGTALSGAPMNVGNYSVKATVAAVANKTNVNSICKTHTITKSNTTTTASAVSTNYTGSAISGSASAVLSGTSTAAPSAAFTYTYYNGSSCSGTALSGAPTNWRDGGYSYKATLTGTDNYNTSTSSCATLVINKIANPMTFTTPQSGSVTFKTSAQARTFTAAASAQGTVTYSIASQKQGSTNVTYFSIPTNTTASMNVAANTPVGTYTIVIKASAAGNTNYNTKELETTYTLTVSKATPTVTTTVSGTSTWGETLTCSATNTGDGTSYTYQWYTATTSGATSGTAISGATSSTYTIDSAYVGKYIGCTATVAATTNYNSASTGTAQTTAVGKVTPVITLSAVSGTVILGNNGTFNEQANVAGTFAVASTNTDVATVTQASSAEIAADTDNTVTMTSVDAGTSTINVTFTPSNTTIYNTATASYALTVNYARIKLDASSTYGTVDGSNYKYIYVKYNTNLSYTQIRGTTAATITPAVRDGYTFEGWYSTTPSASKKVLNADGTLTNLTITNYIKSSKWVTKANRNVYAGFSKAMTDLDITLSDTEYIYDGNAKTPTVTVKDGSTTLTEGTDYTVSYSNNTAAGTATVTITSKTVYNSTTKAFYTGNASRTFTIGKASNPMTFTTPQSGSVTFATSEQARTFTATANAQGTVTYAIQSQKQGSTNVTYFSIPTNTTASMNVSANTPAGTYTIVIKASAAGNTNYNTKELETTYTLTVNRKGIAFPSCTSKVYTATEQTLFAAHTTGEYTNSVLKGTNVNDYTVSLTPTANYQWNSGTDVTSARTLTCSITKADTTTAASAVSTNYTGSAINGNASAVLSGTSTTAPDAAFTYTYYNGSSCSGTALSGAPTTWRDGGYSYKATLTGTSNYNTSTSSCATLVINKVDATCPTLSNYSGISDNTAHSITVTGGSGGTIQYRTSSTGEWTTTKPTRTGAGTTTVYVQVAADENHNTVQCYQTGTTNATIKLYNARIDFNLNGGTISNSGNNPLYVRKNATAVYTGRTNSTAATIPIVEKDGYTFNGWYTASSGGSKVIAADKTVQASVSGWTDSSKKWLRTSTSNTANTNPLYAQWTYTATPIITLINYNTFEVSAIAGSEYFISKTQTTVPAANADGWSIMTTQHVSTSAKETYYVWVKDINGNVSANYATISNYEVRTPPNEIGSVLVYADAQHANQIDYDSYVLDGTPVYLTYIRISGYHDIQITKNSVVIDPEENQIINSDTTFSLTGIATPTPTITVIDHDTFSFGAESGAVAYYVSNEFYMPTPGVAQETFALDSWTTATNTGNLSLADGEIYYVWAEHEASTSGVVSMSPASIPVRKVVKNTAGTGTTLTTKYDSSSGPEFTGTVYVLNGSKVNVTGSLSTGYNTLVLKNGSTTITAGDKVITSNASFTSSATANIYHVTLNNQSATTTGTTEVYYQYNTSKKVGTETCYYYTDDELTACLTGHTITIPTKTGYTFGGYYTETNGSGTNYVTTAGKFQNEIYKTVGDKTLYAKWTEKTATLTYANGGHGTAPANVTMKYTTATNAAAALTADGYTFGGWSGSNGNTYAAGAQVKAANVVPSALTLTGIWTYTATPTITLIDYNTFEYSAAGASKYIVTTTNTKPTTSTSGWTTETNTGDLTLAADTIYYVWAQDADGNISDNSASIAVRTVTRSVGTGTSFGAKYTNSSGSSLSWTSNKSYVLSGTIIYVTASLKTGYESLVFKKGSTAISSKTKHTISTDTTFTTSATAKTYTITYDFGGNVLDPGNPATYQVTTPTFTLINPTWSEHTFVGWTGSNGTTPQTTVTIAKGSTENKTYTANWIYTATPTITIIDHNTFEVLAHNAEKYFISKTQTTAPTADATGWSTSTSQDVSTSTKETWYVWIQDSSGNVSANYATVTNYNVTVSAGIGTTLTAKVDSSSGANANGMYVLDGSNLYVSGTLLTGYSSLIIKNNSIQIEYNALTPVTADAVLTSSATLSDPNVTISGAATKIYGSSATTLTCNKATTYGSGITAKYSFGYSTSDGGTPSNWSEYSTANTFTISATEFIGTRYYSCRAYASDGTETSQTSTSLPTADAMVRINNATISFNANGGTVNGSDTLYTRTGSSNVYASIRSSSIGTIPTATKADSLFIGWFTSATGGSRVLTENGNIYTHDGSVSGYTNVSGTTATWTITSNITLYAHYISVGDYVSYASNTSSFTTDINKTGCDSADVIYPSELTLWRVIRVNNNGTFDAVSDELSSTTVCLKGNKGYMMGIQVLNELASKYEDNSYTIGSRHFGYSNQTEKLVSTSAYDGSNYNVPWTCSTGESCNPSEPDGGGDQGWTTDYTLVITAYCQNNNCTTDDLSAKPHGSSSNDSYWVASRGYNYVDSTHYSFGMRDILYDFYDYHNALGCLGLRGNNNNSWTNGSGRGYIRPIVTFNAKIYNGSGTEGNPFTLIPLDIYK